MYRHCIIPRLWALVSIACAALCPAMGSRADRVVRESSRPSVLLITLDTVRADHLSCYGYSRIQTPNIDRLAVEGLRFANAYTQVPITLPSHAVILTGTYPMFNGVRDFTSPGLPAGIPTLAEALRHNGYHTAAFVSSFVLNSMWGLDRGFETYDDDMGPDLGESAQLFLVQRPGDRTVDRALDWISRNSGRNSGRNSSEPFFVWLHLYDAHSPYRAPDPYRTRYRSRPYDGAIAFDDAQVGRVFARLRQLALYDNTLVVLTSDHGESLGEHGEAEHGFFVYDSTLHVPLILRLPRSCQGGPCGHPEQTGQSAQTSRLSLPVSTVDIASTIAQVCRIPSADSGGFQGHGLLTGLTESPKAASGSQDDAVYAESYYPRNSFGWHELRAVVTSKYEYVEAPRPELYDLRDDRVEHSNVITAHAAAASALHAQLAAFASRFTTTRTLAPPKSPDPETVEKLRSLGYTAYRSARTGAKADPKDKIATFNQILHAGDLSRQGEYKEADRILSELVRQEPALYVVHFERGENYLAWGQAESAKEEFRKTLSINPAFDQAALGLGRAYMLSGEDREAAASFELALRSNPGNFLARVALAKVYRHENLMDRARSELAQVVESHPRFAQGHADYGVVMADLRRYQEAAAEIQRGIDLGFRDAVAYNYLGIARANIGDNTQAIEAYKTATRLKPDYAAPYLNLALQYVKEGRRTEADGYYQRVCAISKDLCRQYSSAFSSPTHN